MGYFVSLNYRNRSSKTPKYEDVGVVINYYYKGKKLRKSVGVEVKPKDWNSDDKECISPLFIGENPEMKLGLFRSFGG